MEITAYLKVLETAGSKSGLNKMQIAERAGLHPNTLRNFKISPGAKREKPHLEWNPLVSTLRALEPVLRPFF